MPQTLPAPYPDLAVQHLPEAQAHKHKIPTTHQKEQLITGSMTWTWMPLNLNYHPKPSHWDLPWTPTSPSKDTSRRKNSLVPAFSTEENETIPLRKQLHNSHFALVPSNLDGTNVLNLSLPDYTRPVPRASYTPQYTKGLKKYNHISPIMMWLHLIPMLSGLPSISTASSTKQSQLASPQMADKLTACRVS